MPNQEVAVHVNSKTVKSNVYDLDVYDTYTLQRAVMSLASQINFWMAEGRPEMAEPYGLFKERIKRHIGGNHYA